MLGSAKLTINQFAWSLGLEVGVQLDGSYILYEIGGGAISGPASYAEIKATMDSIAESKGLRFQ